MKLLTIYRTILYFLLVLAMIIPSGCEKSITEPDPEIPDPPIEIKFDAVLHASKLSVAIPREWTEDIIITALDENVKPENFSAASGNTGIATVTQSENTLTITGIDYGKTSVTITSNSGKRIEIPVNIYNHRILETDELLITYSDDFERRYARPALSFWHPKRTTDGFKPVGSLYIGGTSNPSGKQGIMMLKAKEGSDALAPPTGFSRILHMRQWNVDDEGSAWIPIAPPGYVALGIVVAPGGGAPSLDDVVTVRKDLTIPAEAGRKLVYITDRATRLGSQRHYAVWEIIPPHSAHIHENAYLPAGTFVYRYDENKEPDKPSAHPVMHVLNVHLPMLTEPASFDEYRPRMTSYDEPPHETVPVLAREMLVPSTILNDPHYSTSERILHSPFYRLERQIYYEVLMHGHNDTELVQHFNETVKYGISQTESQEIWVETGIDISFSGGISIKMVEAGRNVTLSLKLGYKSLTSVTEFHEKSYTAHLSVPPGKAATLFHRYSRFVLKRHNENTKSFEVVKIWDVSNQSYHHAQYPPHD